MREHHGAQPSDKISVPSDKPRPWTVSRKRRPGDTPVTVTLISDSAFAARQEASVLWGVDPDQVEVSPLEETKP